MGEQNMTETLGFNLRKVPWRGKKATDQKISVLRPHFHFVSWEFGTPGYIPSPSLNVTDWENPNLLSILVIRDPISRLLSPGGFLRRNFPNIYNGNGTHDDWWGYANHKWNTNNYALRVLAGKDCCDGSQTNRMHLENAKALVERVSIVLDIACLTEGIEALASLVNVTLSGKKQSSGKKYAPSRERIGYDDVYEYLLEKNKLDIELYEWSKTRALIDCSSL